MPAQSGMDCGIVVEVNEQYWEDLVFEGKKLTDAVEGAPRDLSRDIAATEAGRAQAHRDGERYRASVRKPRTLDLDREEHQLQDVIDAYRWNHPEVNRMVHRGIGFERPGR
ncbi:hypothetical protein [Gordonia sp. SND2]|uniref:hypothetical protein n=1 Tax=Gordonia sp. SND2 TaxID=3388659 RepID=UPI00398B1845